MIKLDIFSDPICPWCHIGKAYLDRALEARPEHAFTIEWHPFQLNPEMPPEGMDRKTYLEAKFGGPENAKTIYGRIEDTARAAGLDVDISGIKRTPNTLNAHRLIHWAGLEERQTFAVAALFKAYFKDQRDIGDIAVLTEIGVEIGLEREMLTRLFASEGDRQMIQDRDAHARAKGISAVPTFIVANQHVMPGAQPPELWMQIIDDIAQQLASGDT